MGREVMVTYMKAESDWYVLSDWYVGGIRKRAWAYLYASSLPHRGCEQLSSADEVAVQIALGLLPDRYRKMFDCADADDVLIDPARVEIWIEK